MVNFAELVELDVDGLEQFADMWHTIFRTLRDVHIEFDESVHRPLRNGHWTGESGEAATAFCARVEIGLESVAAQVKSLRDYIDTEADGARGEGGVAGLQRHHRAALDYQREAAGLGMTIEADGTLRYDEPAYSPAEEDERAEQRSDVEDLQRRIRDTLAAATELDQNLARNLTVIFGTLHNFETETREYDVLPPNGRDERIHNQLNNIAAYFATVKGWPTAAGLIMHYLEGSGQDVVVDPAVMMRDIPAFQEDVDAVLEETRDLPDGPFQTRWLSTAPDIHDGDSSLEWYYALNHFQYRLVGEKDGDEITYRVDVMKRYDWGIPSEHRRTLEGGWGPLSIEMEQADIARLHSVGMAQDFNVYGSSDVMRTTL